MKRIESRLMGADFFSNLLSWGLGVVQRASRARTSNKVSSTPASEGEEKKEKKEPFNVGEVVSELMHWQAAQQRCRYIKTQLDCRQGEWSTI